MSHVEKLQDYFRRQYETEEGSLEDNINALFAADAVYHIGGEAKNARQVLLPAAEGLRATPPAERMVAVSDFVEEGDTVHFRMHVRSRNVETGNPVEAETDHTWHFNADGMVVEAIPQQLTESDFRAIGGDL